MSLRICCMKLLDGVVQLSPNNSLHRTFDPLPILAVAKNLIASNAGELRR
jgi:hypothetical protein